VILRPFPSPLSAPLVAAGKEGVDEGHREMIIAVSF
jgi:hypothetical protein